MLRILRIPHNPYFSVRSRARQVLFATYIDDVSRCLLPILGRMVVLQLLFSAVLVITEGRGREYSDAFYLCVGFCAVCYIRGRAGIKLPGVRTTFQNSSTFIFLNSSLGIVSSSPHPTKNHSFSRLGFFLYRGNVGDTMGSQKMAPENGYARHLVRCLTLVIMFFGD